MLPDWVYFYHRSQGTSRRGDQYQFIIDGEGGGGVWGWQPVAAVFEDSCRHFLHVAVLPPSLSLTLAPSKHWQVLYKGYPIYTYDLKGK